MPAPEERASRQSSAFWFHDSRKDVPKDVRSERSQAVATQRMPAPEDGTGSARGVDAPGAVGLPPSSLVGSLRFQGSVEDQIYAMGWPITPLILPPASGGNGLLIYTFDPAVPGLTFDAQERTLNRPPVEAGRRAT